MRILHTSDWHLGKSLEGYSRIPEQEKFLQELLEIVEREEVELILISGDIYDHSNPPASAERLFYKSMKKLSNDGQRAIVVIAGNHDNPDRLTAASPLAYEHGIILLGTPTNVAQTGKYKGFEIVESQPGYIRLTIGEEDVVIIALPYPSEKRLNEIINIHGDEEEAQSTYSQRIGEIFEDLSKHYREDTINLCMSHLYMIGGKESNSERQIQLGGTMAVEVDHLPPAQYTALGHLHRPQRVGGKDRVYYSGSPLQYSKSEVNYSKCVYRVDVEPGKKPEVQPIYLKNYKPIEIWKCQGVEEALARCKENADKDIWAYIEIETDRVLTREENNSLRDLKKDIVEIRPILIGGEMEEEETEDLRELDMMDLFSSFYFNSRGVEPSEELKELFCEIVGIGGEEDETYTSKD